MPLVITPVSSVAEVLPSETPRYPRPRVRKTTDLAEAAYVLAQQVARLREYNTCHLPAGQPTGGQFCSGAGTLGHIDTVVAMIANGESVELPSITHVNTLLTRLASIAKDAKAKGKEAPTYDLCKVSVKGTNLFCSQKLTTKEFPRGISRIEMPQFGGVPVPGSPADRLPRNPGKATVDGADYFVSYLKNLGIKTTDEAVNAAILKASQSELIGEKVAEMMFRKGYDPGAKRIFISRDDYVVDGHHRWAAVVGRDAEDGIFNSKVKVTRIDAPIAEVLLLAKHWTKRFGIQAKGVE